MKWHPLSDTKKITASEISETVKCGASQPNRSKAKNFSTFATRCYESGIPVEVYNRWLGHSKTSKVTESVYTHLDEIQSREAAKFTLSPKI